MNERELRMNVEILLQLALQVRYSCERLEGIPMNAHLGKGWSLPDML